MAAEAAPLLVREGDVRVHDGLAVEQRDVADHARHLEALVVLQVHPLLSGLVVVADGGPGNGAQAREPGKVDAVGVDEVVQFLEQIAPEGGLEDVDRPDRRLHVIHG